MENSLPGISPAPARRARVASSGRTHSSTRETLLRLIEAQRSPSTVAGLAALSGCHENTVRGHLQELWQDGYLVREQAAAAGKGRPSWLWSAKASPVSSPYAGLAIALSDGLAADTDASERALAAGREWGRTIAATLPASTDAAEARRAVINVMRDQGFAPRVSKRAPASDARQGSIQPEEATVFLRHCPLVAAATHRPEIVCAVHLGMVSGVLDGVGARDAGSTLLRMSGLGECSLNLRVEHLGAPTSSPPIGARDESFPRAAKGPLA